MEETDEIEGLRERLAERDAQEDELLRTIESDSWEHLRTTTDMETSSTAPTGQHIVPPELLEASRPTREQRAVVPRDDDERWTASVGRVSHDGQLELPDEISNRLQSGERVFIKVFIDDER